MERDGNIEGSQENDKFLLTEHQTDRQRYSLIAPQNLIHGDNQDET